MHRFIGAYLMVVASIQLILYVASLSGGSLSLFYFDPRIGLFFLETMVRQQEVYPGLLSWVSAVALGVVGLQMQRNPQRVRRYLILEPIMALPTVLMSIIAAAANLNPGHGFSTGELVTPLAVLVVSTVVPYGLAWKFRFTLANMPLQPASGTAAVADSGQR